MDILYAWIASIASAMTPLITKASSKSLIKSPWLFNILWVTFSIPFIATLGFIKGGGMPNNWEPLLLLSACYAAYYVCITLSVFKLDVSTVAPLFSLRAAFAVILGILFLHESISLHGLALIAIIILATPLAAYNQKLRMKAFLHKYVFVAVAAMAFLALVGFFTNISVSQNGYGTTLLWQGSLSLLLLAPTLKLVDFKQETASRRKIYPFLLLGVTGFIYMISATTAYAHNLALSSVIVSLPLSMIFAYLLGKIHPRFLEGHSGKVYAIRFSGAFVMVGCAIWLSFL